LAFFAKLQRGTSFETGTSRLKVEAKDRFTGFCRSPQQAESLAAAGDNVPELNNIKISNTKNEWRANGVMKQITTYAGKKVLVLGLAKSGTNAAKLLKRLGATVTVSDVQPLAENQNAQ